MIRVLIVEDEDSAAERLIKMLAALEREVIVSRRCESISQTVAWLQQDLPVDLILMDIQLADGPSFEIFSRTEVKAPVIFITAYDEYAIQAFKVNSIDYLLKPLKAPELEAAIAKFEKNSRPASPDLSAILQLVNADRRQYQKRFVVKSGQMIKAVDTAHIAYFYTKDRLVLMTTADDKRYTTDHKLDELEDLLDPAVFFRVNRQLIVNINAIDKMFTYTKSRVKIMLNPQLDIEVIVSSERSAEFKTWLAGKTV
jgi:two-component system response regulator LytT